MKNMSSSVINHSSPNDQLGINSPHAGTHGPANIAVMVISASSGYNADIRAKSSTLAASAAASDSNINSMVGLFNVNAGGSSFAVTKENGNSVLLHGEADIFSEDVEQIAAVAAAVDDAKNGSGLYDHENSAKVPRGGRRGLGTTVVGLHSCHSEAKHVKRLAKAAEAVTNGIEHAIKAAAAESWNSTRCIPRTPKLRTVILTPRETVHRTDDQQMMIEKGSNIDNNNVGAVLHGWLQGMRETSPPRTRSPTAATSSSPFHMDAHIEAATTDEDLELIHRAWMVKHPSALDKLEEIVEAASGKRVAVFLDYDGTLSPIVEDPDRAFMSHQMRAIVKEVANVFPTAIISGRCKEKLHEFVQLPELYYAGSHGMEIIGPARPRDLEETRTANTKDNEVVLFQPAKEFTYVIDKVFKVLVEKTKGVPGARVEHNKFCVSVHFRCVKERHWIALAEQVQQVLQSFPNLRLTQGRKVLEIRPLIAWNKGKALDFLLKSLGLSDQNTVFPIYLGDDRSDEDAFKVLNRKKHGLGILVTTVAKETNAVCSLRDPCEVGELLKRLVKWKRRRLNKYL